MEDLKNSVSICKKWEILGAHYLESATTPHSCHGIFVDWLIFRSISPASDSHGRTTTNHEKPIWRHCVTELKLLFFQKRKGILKIDRSVNMSWHGLSIGVVCSYSCAPGDNYVAFWVMGFCPQTCRSLLTVYFFLFFCLFATGSQLLLRVAGVPI